MKTKILWWITGIIGVVFILFLVILAATTDIVKFGAVAVFSIIIIFIVIGINLISIYLKRKRDTITTEKDGMKMKAITLDEAKIVATKAIESEQYSDYIHEKIFEGIWNKGHNNSPIYVLLCEGEFESVYYGICINMENSKPIVRKYEKTKDINKFILPDLEHWSNLISTSPRPTPRTEEELIERPSGERVIRTRDINDEVKEEKKEGELK